MSNYYYDVTITDEMFGSQQDLDVHYVIRGSHRAATRFEPAESPELEMLSVKLGEIDLLPEMDSEATAFIQDLVEDEHEDEGPDDPFDHYEEYKLAEAA